MVVQSELGGMTYKAFEMYEEKNSCKGKNIRQQLLSACDALQKDNEYLRPGYWAGKSQVRARGPYRKKLSSPLGGWRKLRSKFRNTEQAIKASEDFDLETQNFISLQITHCSSTL